MTWEMEGCSRWIIWYVIYSLFHDVRFIDSLYSEFVMILTYQHFYIYDGWQGQLQYDAGYFGRTPISKEQFAHEYFSGSVSRVENNCYSDIDYLSQIRNNGDIINWFQVFFVVVDSAIRSSLLAVFERYILSPRSM